MVTVGLIFLIPQYYYEHSVGLELNPGKAFYIILFYVVLFPAIAAYYCWKKAIELIGPNRSSMFIQLMPLFSALMAIVIFNEKFQMYHFIGAGFIILAIYLSNKKPMIKVAVLDDYQNIFEQIIDLDIYKDKFEFTVFNETFQNEKEASVALEEFNVIICNARKNSYHKIFNK